MKGWRFLNKRGQVKRGSTYTGGQFKADLGPFTNGGHSIQDQLINGGL